VICYDYCDSHKINITSVLVTIGEWLPSTISSSDEELLSCYLLDVDFEFNVFTHRAVICQTPCEPVMQSAGM